MKAIAPADALRRELALVIFAELERPAKQALLRECRKEREGGYSAPARSSVSSSFVSR